MIVNRVRINKAGKPDKEPEVKVYRLTDIEPQFVSLVTAGANRQTKFQVVKAGSCLLCGSIEACGCPAWSRVDKAVPAADATSEDKRQAQMQRAKQYGIEELEAGANLSYPSGDPTTESLYGDPVNLKYPFGRTNNQPDVNRIRNALARFKQAHGTYSQEKSKAVIYSRIVTAALAQGVNVSYDSADPIDRLLPQELVDRLAKNEDEKKSAKTGGSSSKGTENADFCAWLENAAAGIDSLLMDARIESVCSKMVDGARSKSVSKDAQVGDVQSGHSVERLLEKSRQLEKALAKAEEDKLALSGEVRSLKEDNTKLRKERDKYRVQIARLRKGVGGTTALMTGNVRQEKKQAEHGKPEDVRWAAGGDMCKRVGKV